MILEPEVALGRRAFPEAQRLLVTQPLRLATDLKTCGWHGTNVHPEDGAFALVRSGPEGFQDEYVGEVLRLTVGSRSCIAYVLAARDLPWDVSLTRRAFMALAPLFTSQLLIRAEVLS